MKKFLHLVIYCVIVICIPIIAPQADSLTINLGEMQKTAMTSNIIKIIALTTILSLAPAIVIILTSFSRIIIVLSSLRMALGLQQTPPNVVLNSLALFLTFFIMAPTFTESYNNGIEPLINNEIEEEEAWDKSIAPFKKFMLSHTRGKDIAMLVAMSKLDEKSAKNPPLYIIVPAFMISELKRAFEISFLIFMPFLVIDLMVASVLMAMGMMMLPPTMLSMPFKLIFFVLVDGWHILCDSLVKSYG